MEDTQTYKQHSDLDWGFAELSLSTSLSAHPHYNEGF